MLSLPLPVVPLILLALLYGFLNGRSYAANIVAPLISTHALNYRRALWLAALAALVGPFLYGVAVAETVGRGLIAIQAITLPVVYAALLAANFWNTVAQRLGFPTSTSHSLAGGLIGAAWIGYGRHAVLMGGLIKIVLALLLSPVLSLLVGFATARAIYGLAWAFHAPPRINRWFQRGQLPVAVALGLAHSSNDAQKTMGLIVLGLVATDSLDRFYVPFWVIALSALVFAAGSLFGSQRTIRTVGGKFYHIRPIHGFSAQAASTVITLGAGLLGGPVSTSHVVSSALVGAGSADRVQMIRWNVAERIVFSWFVTVPVVAFIAVMLYETWQVMIR
ncbi:MAG: inorganic phosphate transporter family protein [Anaerolineae bacterium]|mgnify:CR=1 FL=1|nr:inorganic phosphate transporter family protein [Anaerolineae bacterium]MEB2287056.1 inorganic phosphate transporter [Anaerolineae bacterium]